jgi:hypothetical protein
MGVEWIDLPEDKNKWQALVNMEMSLASIKHGIY